MIRHQESGGVRKGRCLHQIPTSVTSGPWSHVQPQPLDFYNTSVYLENQESTGYWKLGWPWLLEETWHYIAPTVSRSLKAANTFTAQHPTFYWTKFSAVICITCPLSYDIYPRQNWVKHQSTLLWHFFNFWVSEDWGCQLLSNDSLAVCWIAAIRPQKLNLIQDENIRTILTFKCILKLK